MMVFSSLAVLLWAVGSDRGGTDDSHSSRLDPPLTGSPAVARTALKPFPSQQMIAHPVSPRINSFRYDDDQLIRPVQPAGNNYHVVSV